MAKLPNSAVVLRFRVGSGLVKARQRYSNTARAILERVTLTYAEGAYDLMRKEMEMQLERDVRAELVHLASLYRRYIIGAGGRRSSPSGSLDTVTKGSGAPSMTIKSGLPPWAPRNAQYVERKRSATGHMRWFDNSNWSTSAFDARYARRVMKSGDAPDDAGLLKRSMTHDSWETWFGPVSVRFYRARKLQATDGVANINTKGKKMQVQIGSLQVRAIGKVTPAMLPGYTSGRIMASASGNEPLMELIAKTDPRVAYRLGTMRNGVYRPTLEPFLGFFLTKSIPYAVTRRLEKGTLGSIIIK